MKFNKCKSYQDLSTSLDSEYCEFIYNCRMQLREIFNIEKFAEFNEFIS